MITLNRVHTDYKKQLMQIDESEIQILWAHYYDIPRNGILLYKGKQYYFQCKDFEINTSDYRKMRRVDESNSLWVDYWQTYFILELINNLAETPNLEHKPFSEVEHLIREIWEKSSVIGWFELFIGSEVEDSDDEFE
jgi:hypothetical protein